MKRINLMDTPHFVINEELQRQVAFHEAGHATSIYFGNHQRQLPPIFFQIYINPRQDTCQLDKAEQSPETINDTYITKIEGGRLIHTLPCSVGIAVSEFSLIQKQAYLAAFNADIINLLAGPLSEANYVALRDNEPINPYLVNLDALHFYGGSSDLETINDYLNCLELTQAQRSAKLSTLFLESFAFIKDKENWKAISGLAEYILSSKKNIITHDDIAKELDQNYFINRAYAWC
jgi:hypothetical protein